MRDRNDRRHHVVLRRWVATDASEGASRVTLECRLLQALERSGIPAPRLLDADPTGSATDGVGSLLMSKVPGRVLLTPRDPDDWIRQMAALLPRVHASQVDAPAFDPWLNLERLRVPAWTSRPTAWRRAIALARGDAPAYESRFIHRDYQHFNLLWSRERLSGIVDWVFSSRGSADIDVGHCRLNLAVLFSADRAERFRRAYEAEAGRTVDPWWDLAELLVYLPGWGPFIQRQAGRYPVDFAGMHARVEEVLLGILKRL